uniref:Uncharacterized protein n=1 Tax=Oryza brachyantha TaxID=4533 RepID=J3LFL4_ORYBR
MTTLMQLCVQVMVVSQELLYLLPCSIDRCPLQVNHILHDGSATSNILSAVLDFGVFIFLHIGNNSRSETVKNLANLYVSHLLLEAYIECYLS